ARSHGGRFAVHCKVDTGMHRVGATPEDAMAVVRAIADDPLLSLEGVWTHFAVAESDAAFTTIQLDRLLAFRKDVEEAGVTAAMWHAA
ncbi:MAG: alanine racemase, partial [Actinobacteria bacterium]|nr:alanine racemase [Actinomycetota bacterium]NIU71235.1 alanine racemase [Actinomycetota bacterium]NIV90692.1 alanine racemase [Actinomycetota bacterium]NIW33190.1 alanine racemase [Actinomycetota bacterium]